MYPDLTAQPGAPSHTQDTQPMSTTFHSSLNEPQKSRVPLITVSDIHFWPRLVGNGADQSRADFSHQVCFYLTVWLSEVIHLRQLQLKEA